MFSSVQFLRAVAVVVAAVIAVVAGVAVVVAVVGGGVVGGVVGGHLVVTAAGDDAIAVVCWCCR